MLLEINGNIENVMNYEDFEYLIEKYMGNESANYYHDLISSMDDFFSSYENGSVCTSEDET